MTPVKRGSVSAASGCLRQPLKLCGLDKLPAPAQETSPFSDDEDRLVVQAFEEVRKGAATERDPVGSVAGPNIRTEMPRVGFRGIRGIP